MSKFCYTQEKYCHHLEVERNLIFLIQHTRQNKIKNKEIQKLRKETLQFAVKILLKEKKRTSF